MPFAYYERLSRRDQAVYRKSDAIPAIRIPDPAELRGAVVALEAGLAADKRLDVRDACNELALRLCRQLRCPPVKVNVLAVRPHNAEGELHGFYEWEEGQVPVIRVWMRTAKQKRVVAFKTFLRTLLHELCHHVDYTAYRLPNSFHTKGFFQRESSLVKQLAHLAKTPP